MTRPFRSQWTTEPEKPEPVDSARTKALRLPRPGPGILVTVPLHLLPEYLDIYRLEPRGVKDPGCILLVRRKESA